MLEYIDTTANVVISLAALITVLVGWKTLPSTLEEFKLQQSAKRAELYFGLRDDYRKTDAFKKIAPLLEADSVELKTLDYNEKLDFLGHYEEIALLNNSGLISDHVAFYMFGYYAIQCWRSEHFWVDMERDSIYWAAFKDFAIHMIQTEKSDSFKLSEFKL